MRDGVRASIAAQVSELRSLPLNQPPHTELKRTRKSATGTPATPGTPGTPGTQEPQEPQEYQDSIEPQTYSKSKSYLFPSWNHSGIMFFIYKGNVPPAPKKFRRPSLGSSVWEDPGVGNGWGGGETDK